MEHYVLYDNKEEPYAVLELDSANGVGKVLNDIYFEGQGKVKKF